MHCNLAVIVCVARDIWAIVDIVKLKMIYIYGICITTTSSLFF